MAKSHTWQSRESVFGLKAIEASGWKTKKDDKLVIEALEGLTLNNSLGNPQGTKIICREDHSGMIDCYISKVENGRLEVKKRSPR
jgi:branched-chain amino acid transport system substrate-binding protein